MRTLSLLLILLSFALASCVTGAGVVSTAAHQTASASNVQAAPVESGPEVFAAPRTFKHDRNFEYTIPAGWYLVDGDPEHGESFSFMKKGTPRGMNAHLEQMVPSFPRAAAVDAGLKQDKERMLINKVLDARRRDDGSIKKGCGVIGWEQTEAPQKNGFQRIIWQCYDGDNYYMNFMTYTENEDFVAARPELREVSDSIKFCRH